jgi:predicted lipid-binding transport protein (Tim44 family)
MQAAAIMVRFRGMMMRPLLMGMIMVFTGSVMPVASAGLLVLLIVFRRIHT